jgi:hypothetical protein
MLTRIRLVLGHWVLIGLVAVAFVAAMKVREFSDFRKILERFKADSRVAEVLVTESRLDEVTGKFVTTIKFLEFDVKGKALTPRYFTFYGNQIQFQALVVRFKDEYVERGHRMKGKSIFLFLKAFVLDPKGTQVFDITKTSGIPEGYHVPGVNAKMQKEIWEHFWKYALDPAQREAVGIKNAQLEAPGSVFVPGTVYTIRIEHDGGLRIDAAPIPEILKGETITP